MKLVLAIATLALAACAAAAKPALDGAWALARMNGGEPPMAATLGLAAGRVSGTAFCNTYDGAYTVSGGRMLVSALGVTKRACAFESTEGLAAAFDPMEAEQTFLGVLQARPRLTLGADSLVLRAEGGVLEFRRAGDGQ